MAFLVVAYNWKHHTQFCCAWNSYPTVIAGSALEKTKPLSISYPLNKEHSGNTAVEIWGSEQSAKEVEEVSGVGMSSIMKGYAQRNKFISSINLHSKMDHQTLMLTLELMIKTLTVIYTHFQQTC